MTLDSSSCGTRFAATCVTLYTLTLNAGNGGTLTVAPADGITATATTGIYTVVGGTDVTVTATPDSAHYLATLGGQTRNSNSADSLTFTVTADTTVSAVFNTKPVLTLAANEATWGNRVHE